MRECEELTLKHDKCAHDSIIPILVHPKRVCTSVRAILNILMPYTSRNEMLTAVNRTIDEFEEKDEFAAEFVYFTIRGHHVGWIFWD